MPRRFPLPYDYFKAFVALVLLLLLLWVRVPEPPTLNPTVDASGTVTLSGSAAAGSEVKVRIRETGSGNVPAEVTVRADDTGSWLTSVELPPGHYSARAAVGGAASNEQPFEVSEPAALAPLTVELPHPPGAPRHLAGRAEPGAWVVVYADGSPIGRVRANASGEWAFEADLLPGAHNIITAYAEAPEITSDPVALEVAPTAASAPRTEAATSAETAPKATSERGGRPYVVQEGDWLSKLAEKFLGDPVRYREIREATNAKAATDPGYATIEEDDLIYPGETIWIPAP